MFEAFSAKSARRAAGLLLLAAVLLMTVALTAPPSHVGGVGGEGMANVPRPEPTPAPNSPPVVMVFTPSGSVLPSTTTWITAGLAITALGGAVAIWTLVHRRRKGITPAAGSDIGSSVGSSPVETPNRARGSQRRAA